MIIDIDCDIYEGTVEALGWMIRHQLLVAGTLLYYDDWRRYVEGETKAHLQVQLAQQPCTPLRGREVVALDG